MSRKLLLMMWLVIVFTGCYIVIMISSYLVTGRNLRTAYIPGLRAFYSEMPFDGMDGLERAVLFRQNGQVPQVVFQGMINDPVIKLEQDFKYIEDIKEKNMNGTDKHADSNEVKKQVGNNSDSLGGTRSDINLAKQFYKLRTHRVNPFDFKFFAKGENVCNSKEPPFLVILCLTTYYDIDTRKAIRETWGSVVRTKTWPPLSTPLPQIKLVFLLGSPEDSVVKTTIIQDENNRHGDLIVADFKDSYGNLTLKVMMGLKWVTDNCREATYVVKIDQDMFLHVLNLVRVLKQLKASSSGVVIGYQNENGKVLRAGKWGVDRKIFPMSVYPNYTNGNCYVISGDVIPKMFDAAERMPYLFIEDAFITGIVRTVIGVSLVHHTGFTRWTDKPPRLCGFHNVYRIAATNVDDERKYNLWKALHYRNLKNCYNVEKRT